MDLLKNYGGADFLDLRALNAFAQFCFEKGREQGRVDERAKTIEECMNVVPFRIDDGEYSDGFNDCSKKVLDRLKAMKGAENEP